MAANDLVFIETPYASIVSVVVLLNSVLAT